MTTPGADERWERVRSLVEHAMDEPPRGRERLIRESCADDEEMLQEALGLLRSIESNESFLETPAIAYAGRPVPEGPPPEEIGGYRVLREIGRGGMGIVYEGEQREPIRRAVAIKVVRHGLETKEIVGRFDAERQALAMMNHSSIARIFDAGATPDGRPFFVMEFVKGAPINEYCDAKRLAVRERLDLFLAVCDGVQHAHRVGVIHRDLKPSNILVAEVDGRPTPKIIDFGVAKALHQPLTEKTLVTEQGRLLGTPEYMSPEQASADGLGVDTRTDIYSLGVLLYELLVGELPFEPETLRQRGLAEILRILREEDPPKPSTRLSGAGDSSAIASRRRADDAGSLLRELRGDLDWITMRAMEKERDRRYGTASELGADVRRHLAGEAVVARPPTAAYLTRKFVRRNRALVSGALAVGVVLVVGAGATSWQAISATRARDRALEAESLAEARLADAEREAAVARAINDFLNRDLLASVNPRTGGIDTTVRQVLETASERVGERFPDQALVEASVRTTLGETYRTLGEYEAAEAHFERALELRASELDADDIDLIMARFNLATIYEKQERFALAEPVYLEVYEARQRLLGPDARPTLISANNLATLMHSQGRLDESIVYMRAVHEGFVRAYGESDRQTLNSIQNLANLLDEMGETEEATRLLEQALAISERELGPDHPDTLMRTSLLAMQYVDLGRTAEALGMMQRVVDTQAEVIGEDHPSRISALSNFAGVLAASGDRERAIGVYTETLAVSQRRLGPDHSYTLAIQGNLSTQLWEVGRRDEALTEREDQIRRLRGSLGARHNLTGSALNWYGRWLGVLGRSDEAVDALEEAYAIRTALNGAEDRRSRQVARDMARVLDRAGRPDEAEAWRARAGG